MCNWIVYGYINKRNNISGLILPFAENKKVIAKLFTIGGVPNKVIIFAVTNFIYPIL